MIKVGDFVKVKDQDIYGFVVETYGNKVVIIDSDSEYEPPDNRLEYRVSELIQKENQWKLTIYKLTE